MWKEVVMILTVAALAFFAGYLWGRSHGEQ
jgi:hypothetical protein